MLKKKHQNHLEKNSPDSINALAASPIEIRPSPSSSNIIVKISNSPSSIFFFQSCFKLILADVSTSIRIESTKKCNKQVNKKSFAEIFFNKFDHHSLELRKSHLTIHVCVGVI